MNTFGWVLYIKAGTLLCYFLCSRISAASLDGTATVVYESAVYNFAGGDYARGFVGLQAGMTIPAGGTVSFNTLVPIRGPITLNGTGTIKLEGPMTLAPDASFVDSGNIDGQGQAILLQGDIILESGVSLTCVSDTIIDGQNHHLIFNSGVPGGQLIIDGPADTTVTLRNISLHGLQDYTALLSSIQFGSNVGQTVVLDNVTLYMSGDFSWQGGGIEVSGKTTVSGAHTFSYLSSDDCMIAQDSALTFDLDTTLFYDPADGNPAHLRFQDQSARLNMIGSTLSVPPSVGLKLFDGHLVIDHFVSLQNDGAVTPNQGIHLGLGGGHDLFITILPAATLKAQSGVVTYGNNDFAA